MLRPYQEDTVKAIRAKFHQDEETEQQREELDNEGKIMGMRQNIELSYANESSKIYIYSHWGGNELLIDSGLAKALADALNRRMRWDDEAYLARIIISEVIADAMGKETGFGISPYEIDPEFPTIKVNLNANRVNDMTFEEFLEHMEAARC